MNWKDEIDRRNQQEAEQNAAEEQRRRQEAEQNAAEVQRRRQEVAEAEYNQKLADHQNRFRCSHPGCTLTSSGPYIRTHTRSVTKLYSGSVMNGTYEEKHTSKETDWNTPTGLVRCQQCGNLFCENHSHKGKCQSCWTK